MGLDGGNDVKEREKRYSVPGRGVSASNQNTSFYKVRVHAISDFCDFFILIKKVFKPDI